MKNPAKSRDVPSTRAGESERERSVTSRVLQAQDEERRKIGRELHDSVGQALAAVKMGIERFRSTRPAAETQSLDEISNTLDSAITEVRTISHLLHPPELEMMGLRATLAWYLEGFGRRTGIETEMTGPEELPTLESGAYAALFRVVQECLTNVHRHSGASHVALRVRVTSAGLELEVNDNGKGFADLNACREGVGILSMQERLAELGGTLRIESGHGAGSSVFATVPRFKAAVVPLKPEPASRATRVLIVDDHPAIRRGLRALLANEASIEVCGEAADVEQAVQLAKELQPDVMILDLQLKNQNGWSVVRDVRAAQVPVKILIYSTFDARYLGESAYRAGCKGAISKGSNPEVLIEAIRVIQAGGSFFTSRADAPDQAG